jgi:DNA-binding NarL/FixJ family response regulator
MASLTSAEPGVIRILVADTTPMNSQMLAEVLAKHRQFLVFESGPGRSQVLAALAQHHPDVAIVSGNSGEERDGVSLTESIRGVSPAIRVLQLLDQSDRQSVVRAFRAGARGVFCRTSSLDLLAKCITRLQEGHVWANAEELNFVMDALSAAGQGHKFAGTGNVKLSRRELDVTRCVAEGLTNREIAARLGLTEHTVKNYLFRIFDKVGVSSRVELVLFALAAPAVSPDPPAPANTQKPPRRSELSVATSRLAARKQIVR